MPCQARKHGEEECSASGSGSPLLLLRCDEARGLGPRVHHHQPVPDGDLAGGDARRELRRWRVRAPARSVHCLHCPRGVVRPRLGPDRVQLRPRRQWHVRDGGVWDVAAVRVFLRRHASEPGGVHAGIGGLLRREPGRRVQPADGGHPGERQRFELRGGRVRRRPAAKLPVGAGREGNRREQRDGGGLPKRVRRVRHGPVLLPRAVREPGDLPADVLLQEVQGGVPRRLQLCLRRPLQHLHLHPVPRLHHHLLLQQEAIGVLIPQQPARLQRLQQKHLCADVSDDAALQLPDIAVCTPGVNV